MSVSKVFVARLANCGVFDVDGLRLGKTRDLIVNYRSEHAPRVVGLLVELTGKRPIFVPIRQLMSIGAGQIIVSGPLDLRKFQQRGEEVRILAELIGRKVTLRDGATEGTIEDVSIQQADTGEWDVHELFVRFPKQGPSLFGKGPTRYLGWGDILEQRFDDEASSAATFLTAHSEMKPSDLATTLLDLPHDRMLEVVQELPDERLADVLEEMYENDQVSIIEHLGDEHAADVLERMQPDDAADLIAKLEPQKSEALLELMEPEDAEDVRMLLEFEPDTAGGLMTNDMVVVSQETTIAEALALIRRRELPAALATTVFVTMSPYEPPTGRFLGLVHFQRLLRHPPHETVGNIMDRSTEPLHTEITDMEVARVLASYDLVAVPVVDDEHRLVGVITVDDVLDHILPEDWRTTEGEHPHPKTGAINVQAVTSQPSQAANSTLRRRHD